MKPIRYVSKADVWSYAINPSGQFEYFNKRVTKCRFSHTSKVSEEKYGYDDRTRALAHIPGNFPIKMFDKFVIVINGQREAYFVVKTNITMKNGRPLFNYLQLGDLAESDEEIDTSNVS